MKLTLPAFQRLRWKLTFSYVFFTPLVLLLTGFLIFLVILVTIELFFVPALVLYGLQQYPIQLSPFFIHNGVPDQQALAFWIKHPEGYPSGYQPRWRTIVDRQGRVVVSTGSEAVAPGSLLQAQLPAQAASNLHTVLTGENNTQGMVSKNADGSIIAIVPIRGGDNRVDGALIDNTGSGIYTQEALYWFEYDGIYIVVSALIYTFFAVIIGMVGGFYTARTITRRFTTLAEAADNWSQGNFSSFVQDTSPDELGQLSQKLNRMAEQLQNLLQTRQKLAILEERNRLARDLHDSVKQHMFVIALQIGTARMRLDSGQGVVEAQQRLLEAERVLAQVQEELKTLIRELRPAALEGKGLEPALQELVDQWKRRTSIPVSLRVEGERALPLLVEEALFRVAQEALSNVARHSNASSVEVQLLNQPEQVTLSIADNGQGFTETETGIQGVGFLSMQERMQALDGNVDIESQPGKGTRVIARCPRQLSEV